MTTNTFGIIFYLKRQKGKNGKAPIYARITVDGKRTEISIKKNIEIDNWNHGKGMAKGKGEEIKALNTYLEQIRSRMVECFQQIQLKKQLVTSEGIKNKYLGIEDKEHTLMKLFDYHNEQMKYTLGRATLIHYCTSKTYLQKFINKELGKSDINLSELNYNFLVCYERFMNENESNDPKRPCRQNTIMKHIQRLRKVVNLALKNEWIEKDPFMKFKQSFTRSTREYLSEEEMSAIEAKDFSIVRLKHAEDLFMFSCYTGLAYIDSYNLTPQNLTLGIDGEFWISTYRKKTDQPVRIPLLPKAMAIIEKYKTHPAVIASDKLLPSFSNQKINAYLKEIADFCGIQKTLTFHIARHTFATTVTLTNGVPIETVSKMLGHTNIRTTQLYAKVIEKKVSQDMGILRSKLVEMEIEKMEKLKILPAV